MDDLDLDSILDLARAAALRDSDSVAECGPAVVIALVERVKHTEAARDRVIAGCDAVVAGIDEIARRIGRPGALPVDRLRAISDGVDTLEAEAERLRKAISEALVLYDEKPSASEWSGCLCPSRGHASDCHRGRIAELRKLYDDAHSTCSFAEHLDKERDRASHLDAEIAVLVTALLDAAARVDIETGLRESAYRGAVWLKRRATELEAKLASAERRAELLADAADLLDAKRTADVKAWAAGAQQIVDLFDPMKARCAYPQFMVMVAEAAERAHLAVRAERDRLRSERAGIEEELFATNEAIADLCHMLEHFCPADIVEVEVIVGEEPRIGTRQGFAESGITEGA